MWAALGKVAMQGLKGGAKKVATNKLLNRKKKKTKKRVSGKEVSDGIMNREKGKKGGALVIKPSMGLVSTAKDLDSPSTSTGDSDIVIIRKQVIQVRDILESTYSAKQAERIRQRKVRQSEKRIEREDKLEKPKVKPKESKGMKLPKLGGDIGNFFAWVAFGVILNKLMELMPALKRIFEFLQPMIAFLGGVFKVTMGLVTGFIDLAYGGVEKIEKAMEAIGGKNGKELFERFGKLFTQVMNGALIAALIGARVGLFNFFRRGPKIRGGPNTRGGGISTQNTKFNQINNRRTFSNNRVRGGQLNQGPLSGIRETLRKIRNRIPFLNNKVSKGSNAFQRNLSKLKLSNANVSKGSNWFTRTLSKFNIFRKTVTQSGAPISGGSAPITQGMGGIKPTVPNVSSASKGKGLVGLLKNLRLPVPKGLTGWKGNAFLNTIFAFFEFKGRKEAGQSNLKATVGTASSTLGGWAGFYAGAKIGAIAGGSIGALFGGVGAAPGAFIGGILGGIFGSMGGSWLAGTGADLMIDQIEKPEKEKPMYNRGLFGWKSTLDWMTGGITDLDQKGSVGNLFGGGAKDGGNRGFLGWKSGIDMATGGLTDFDRKGSRWNLFNPSGITVRRDRSDTTGDLAMNPSYSQVNFDTTYFIQPIEV